jgi:hypothetical protein
VGFFVNCIGNKKDLCILQRLILIVPEQPLEHDGKIKSRDFPIFESREVNITFQGLLCSLSHSNNYYNMHKHNKGETDIKNGKLLHVRGCMNISWVINKIII